MFIKIMKKTSLSLTERKGTGFKQSHTSMKKKPTPTNPKIMRKNGEFGQHKKRQGAEDERENVG